MTTPTPLRPIDKALDDNRSRLIDLTAALQRPQKPFVLVVLTDAVLAVFERTAALIAPPQPISDTNGSDPSEVEGALFTGIAQAELLTLPRTEPNGFDHRAV